METGCVTFHSEKQVVNVSIDGIECYITLLLWIPDAPKLKAPIESVIPSLRSTERRLLKDQEKRSLYNEEVLKLVKGGYVKKIPPESVNSSAESSPSSRPSH